MRHHLYDIRISLLILLGIICGFGMAWGGEASFFVPPEYSAESKPLPKYYQIDWQKIKTYEDLITIFSLIPIWIGDNHEEFEKIRHLLKEEGR